MWQPVFMVSGFFMSIMGLAMLIPAGLDMYDNGTNWSYFLNSSIISLFLGLSLYLANHMEIKKLSLQQGYLLTAGSWISIILISALPFIQTGVSANFADALFESASGLTGTGATIFSDLENLPRSILLWRSLLCGLGGIGIVVFAIAILPFLGIGGMQIFQHESSDFNDKLMPKLSYLAKRIIFIYLLLVICCLLALKFSGMNWFDALNHALSTVATCGFSTKDESIAFYDSATIDIVITLFMFLGSLPLTYYYVVIINKNIHSFRTAQVIFYLKLLFIYIGGTTIWLWLSDYYPNFWTALRFASFNVVSITTSTGYASTDYLLWGNLSSVIFLIFALTGGCTGSTSGSIKIFRWQVVLAFVKKHLISAVEPNRVVPVKIGTLTSDNKIVSSVFVFLSAYFFSIIILTFLLALFGLDFDTALSTVIGCITNSGPGIEKSIGPVGNYSGLAECHKYILSFAMLLGRLEIMTILVIMTRSFWKQ